MKKTGVLIIPFGVKKAVLVHLRVLSLKRSTAGAFAVPFRVLSRKNMTGDNVLCRNWYLLEEKKIQATLTKQDLVPLRGSTKFPTSTQSFLYGSSPPYPRGRTIENHLNTTISSDKSSNLLTSVTVPSNT